MLSVKKNSLLKLTMLLVVTALILGAAQFAPGVAAAADLDIYVDGAATPAASYTYAQLGDVNDFEQHQFAYSTINTYGNSKDYVAEGPALEDVLGDLLEDAKTITVTSSDGKGNMTFTVQELINDTRYSYIYNPRAQVPTILALLSASNTTDPADMTSNDQLRLMMGQRTSVEQNNVWQIKLINRIDVSTTNPNPANWAAPTASPVQGTVPSGTQVTLSHPAADLSGSANIGVKIYYNINSTVDPSINSTMYNVSAWAPNPPIEFSGSGTYVIKAIVIGPGYGNSAVATFTYTVQ